MTPSPLQAVHPDTTMAEAAKLLYEHKIDAVPVLDEGKVVGILTTSDFLRTFWQTQEAPLG
jgi:CBS domain-containing protein